MEKIRVACPKCNHVSVKMYNPEMGSIRSKCRKCSEPIEVRFENDEIQLWSELDDETDTDQL